MIALEIAGLVEVGNGSGVYVCGRPSPAALAGSDAVSSEIGPFDLFVVPLAVEGEVAAMAAGHRAAWVVGHPCAPRGRDIERPHPGILRDPTDPMWGRIYYNTLRLSGDGTASAPNEPGMGVDPNEKRPRRTASPERKGPVR
jgi:hypothetical protein